MATQDERIAALEKELSVMKHSMERLQDAVKATKSVKSSVSGPRMSDVFVDSQAMPLRGQFTRAGEREIELDEPISVFVALRGIVGTDTTIVTEINNKKKEEKVTMKKQKEFHEFEYTFADFGL